MSIRKYLVASALASAVMVASPASAALLQVQVSSSVNSGSFLIDSMPSAVSAGTGNGFGVNVPVTINGQSYNGGSVFFGNGSTSVSTLRIDSGTGTFIFFDQQKIYTRPDESPTISTGTFTLRDISTNLNRPLTATVTISLAPDVTPAVPEPATWAMMLVGFGMIGGTARYRRRSVKVSHA